MLKNFSVDIWFTNGEKKVLTLEDCVHNGLETKEEYFSLTQIRKSCGELKDERLLDVVNVKGNLNGR